MADVKVNGNTYNGITHIQLAKAEGGGYQKFIEGEGQWTTEGIAAGTEPNGAIVMTGNVLADYAFAGKPITSFEAAEISSVTGGSRAFAGCKQLVSFKCDSMVIAPGFVFEGCTALKNVDIKPIDNNYGVNYGTGFFNGCTSLEEITLYGNTGQSMVGGCTALKKVDMHKGNLAGYVTFSNCSALKTLILRQTEIHTLRGPDVFNGTPFANGGTGGTIYVPEALIASYKTAAQWSIVDGYGTITWKAIEGSEYDESV